jgi:DNA-binding CsgD family transcriptional regulator
MNDADKIARLTEREKVSLQQWLQHKTAKEIAIDLGISHHAVEKRLRMARIKLGAATSLEAARMLRDAEQSGRTVSQSPEVPDQADPGHQVFTRPVILGAITMTLIAAAVLAFVAQGTGAPAEPAQSQTAADGGRQISAQRASEPTTGTEAALRSLVAGLARGSPDYDKLSPQFAEVVRRDLPMTQGMFASLGELKSMTFRERGARGDDAYNLVFANGEVIMSAALDAEGRMAGGILQPVGASALPATAGTEAALRSLVAGLARGSPDYDKLSPQFAEVVRRDLPMTHPMFRGMGELKSVTFRERGPRGDDAYNLVFANGEMIMSAALDAEGRMAGGILQPGRLAGR